MGMEKWGVSGSYFEACNCDSCCPCIFLSAPTQGGCDGAVLWEIQKGNYGSVDLKGLRVAFLLSAPGPLTEGKWKSALYVDERADKKQRDALQQIFGGKAGGHPAVLAGFVGDFLGVKFVPIDMTFDGNRRSVSIPGILEAEVSALPGQDGKTVTVNNNPLAVAPGETLTVGKSTKYKYSDYGLSWEWPGHSGLFSPFAYTGP